MHTYMIIIYIYIYIRYRSLFSTDRGNHNRLQGLLQTVPPSSPRTSPASPPAVLLVHGVPWTELSDTWHRRCWETKSFFRQKRKAIVFGVVFTMVSCRCCLESIQLPLVSNRWQVWPGSRSLRLVVPMWSLALRVNDKLFLEWSWRSPVMLKALASCAKPEIDTLWIL